MRCKEVKELLKSDYLDGELKPEDMLLVLEHLEKCPQCKKLEEELLVQRKLFQEAGHKEVPERIWQNIREKIVTERLQKEGVVPVGVLSHLRQRILQPRVAFSLVSALAVIIFAVALTVQRQASVSVSNTEIIPEYNLNGASANYISDFGTSVEEYFL